MLDNAVGGAGTRMMRETFQLQRARVTVDHDQQRVTTTFGDGKTVPAVPQYTEEAVRTAVELGYLTDPVWEMTRTHDLFHTLVAEAEGREYSAALRPVATGEPCDATAAHREECLVFLLQRLHAQGERFLQGRRVADGQAEGDIAGGAGCGAGEARNRGASAGHGGGQAGVGVGMRRGAREGAADPVGQDSR